MATKKAADTSAPGNEVILLDGDESAIGTLELLKAELKNLTSITETAYKTSGVVEGFSINIQQETKIENLVRMVASVNGRNNAYNEAQEMLSKELGGEISIPVFKINNANAADIIADIVLRIRVISVEDRKKELQALVEEGKKFLTAKDQFKLYQAKVAKLAKK